MEIKPEQIINIDFIIQFLCLHYIQDLFCLNRTRRGAERRKRKFQEVRPYTALALNPSTILNNLKLHDLSKASLLRIQKLNYVCPT